MQESLLTAFSKLDTFKGDATFGSWLKRIVVNNSITQYKKSQRFVPLPESGIADQVDESNDGLDEEDYTSIKAGQIINCMNSLHDSYKQALSLHLVEGYDYEEICEIMNINYANCRTLISRAKQSLRNKLTMTT